MPVNSPSAPPYGIPTFLQDAAVVALEQFPHGLPELKTAYRRHRDRLCD